MSDLERAYLERRRDKSLTSAENATDPAVTKIHYELADQYDRQLSPGGARNLGVVDPR